MFEIIEPLESPKKGWALTDGRSDLHTQNTLTKFCQCPFMYDVKFKVYQNPPKIVKSSVLALTVACNNKVKHENNIALATFSKLFQRKL